MNQVSLGQLPILWWKSVSTDFRRARMDFLQNDNGQDLVEYSLLLAFIVVASVALFFVNMSSVAGIWCAGNRILATGNSMARSGTS
jgi:Flp pilus assembly pilin Flp